MLSEILVLVALPLLLAAAAGWDVASFTIPNFLNLALMAVFAVFALSAGLSFSTVGWHLLAGIIALAIGFALFALGHIGGGDAKLFAAVVLWLGLKDFLPYALLASLFGGGLALGLIVLRQWPLPGFLVRYGWIAKLHDGKSGIPYGVALAAGAFVLLPSTEIFRLAAGA
ncbi:MAG TPA: prepilin peptidase [Rhizomicrobium sp.]|jgi:prepilin peptidase CpaA|nr:prepilin peptidase [Rhizomicrobium sp.]